MLSGLAIGKRPAMLVVAQLSPPLQGLEEALGHGPKRPPLLSWLEAQHLHIYMANRHPFKTLSRQNLLNVLLGLGGGGIWEASFFIQGYDNPARYPRDSASKTSLDSHGKDNLVSNSSER